MCIQTFLNYLFILEYQVAKKSSFNIIKGAKYNLQRKINKLFAKQAKQIKASFV